MVPDAFYNFSTLYIQIVDHSGHTMLYRFLGRNGRVFSSFLCCRWGWLLHTSMECPATEKRSRIISPLWKRYNSVCHCAGQGTPCLAVGGELHLSVPKIRSQVDKSVWKHLAFSHKQQAATMTVCNTWLNTNQKIVFLYERRRIYLCAKIHFSEVDTFCQNVTNLWATKNAHVTSGD